MQNENSKTVAIPEGLHTKLKTTASENGMPIQKYAEALISSSLKLDPVKIVEDYAASNPDVDIEKVIRFVDYALHMPPTGIGKGNHPKQFRALVLAKEAGIPSDKAVDILADCIDDSRRALSPSELTDTAYSVYYGDIQKQEKRYMRPRANGPLLRNHFLDQTRSIESPRDWLKEHSTHDNILEALYKPEERVFIGQAKESPKVIPTVAEHLKAKPGSLGPYFIPNPMTGKPAPLRTNPNKMSCRCDNAIASFRYLVCEVDAIDGQPVPIDDQLRLWVGAILCNVPVVSITWSGNKSAHALVYCPCEDIKAWKNNPLFFPYLVPMGVDPVCANASRLSRMPGFASQELIYLNPGAYNNDNINS